MKSAGAFVLIVFLTLISSLSAKAQKTEDLENELVDILCECITNAYLDNPDIELDIKQVTVTCFTSMGEKNLKKFQKYVEASGAASMEEGGAALGAELVKNCDFLMQMTLQQAGASKGTGDQYDREALESELTGLLCDCVTNTYDEVNDPAKAIVRCFAEVAGNDLKKFQSYVAAAGFSNNEEAGTALGARLLKDCDFILNLAAEEGISTSPAEDDYALAEEYYAEGDYESAAELYWQVHLKSPYESGPLNDLGICNMVLGRYEEAIAAFVFAIKLDPENAMFHANLGETYYDADRSDKALEHLETAVMLNPDLHRPTSFLGLIQASYSGEFEQGVENMLKAIEAVPEEDEYWNNLGMAYYYDDRNDTAIIYFREAYKRNPSSTGLDNIAYLYYTAEQYDSSVFYYTKVIDRDPGLSESWVERASVYDEMAEWDLALSDYEKALALDPDQYYLHYNIGNIYFQSEQYGKAIKEMDKLEKKQELTDAHYLLKGKAYYELNKYKDAMASFEAGLEIEPDNAYFFDFIGKTQLELGNYEEAIEAFSRSIEIYDTDGEIYYLRGKTKLELSDTQGACEDFSMGMEYNNLESEDAYNEYCQGE